MTVIGVIYICNKCLREAEKAFVIGSGSPPAKAKCAWCGSTESVRQVRAEVPVGYDPSKFINPVLPSGVPWYITVPYGGKEK